MLYGSLLEHSGRTLFTESVDAEATGLDSGQFLTWLAAAIQIARRLRLDQLTADPRSMPLDDPAWPSGLNAVKRKEGRRLRAFLVLLDGKTSEDNKKHYHIAPESCARV